MADPTPRFPFGSPLESRASSPSEPRRLFLLGAYPSALHVEWTPPAPFERVAALAVDNEPMPFWTGDDEAARIEAWAKKAAWSPEWGTVGPVGALNGSSGLWLDEKVLAPIAVTRAETWITDCLDTYRFSRGQERVVTSKFEPFAAKFGLPWKGVPLTLRHPSEDEIFDEARELHLARLERELRAAAPQLVVTLGNAALRMFAKLVGRSEPEKLVPDRNYGTTIEVSVGGKAASWLPLVHPGQRSKEWQAIHAKWIRARTRPA
jgi:hypothetical protein